MEVPSNFVGGENREMNTVALCRDPPTTADVAGFAPSFSASNPIPVSAALGIRDRGSISETESEGSDVNLLRDLRDITHKLVTGMGGVISIASDTNVKVKKLGHRTEDISAAMDYQSKCSPKWLASSQVMFIAKFRFLCHYCVFSPFVLYFAQLIG